MKTFYENGEEFRADVVPNVTDPEQIKNLKLVYYAGAAALMNLHYAIFDADLPDEQSESEACKIEEELDIFFEIHNDSPTLQ